MTLRVFCACDESKHESSKYSPKGEVLKTMGEQIKLARLRRNLSAELVAERAGISRASLWKVESGNPACAMGIYAAVLHALNNMDKTRICCWSRKMMKWEENSRI